MENNTKEDFLNSEVTESEIIKEKNYTIRFMAIALIISTAVNVNNIYNYYMNDGRSEYSKLSIEECREYEGISNQKAMAEWLYKSNIQFSEENWCYEKNSNWGSVIDLILYRDLQAFRYYSKTHAFISERDTASNLSIEECREYLDIANNLYQLEKDDKIVVKYLKWDGCYTSLIHSWSYISEATIVKYWRYSREKISLDKKKERDILNTNFKNTEDISKVLSGTIYSSGDTLKK